jgi:hypothetical protein
MRISLKRIIFGATLAACGASAQAYGIYSLHGFFDPRDNKIYFPMSYDVGAAVHSGDDLSFSLYVPRGYVFDISDPFVAINLGADGVESSHVTYSFTAFISREFAWRRLDGGGETPGQVSVSFPSAQPFDQISFQAHILDMVPSEMRILGWSSNLPNATFQPLITPLPAAAWLFATGLAAIGLVRRWRETRATVGKALQRLLGVLRVRMPAC